ncbi:MAG: radical SAM protein [Gaiellales bacterium]|nr:MAG: radical SAM protein [Gaiellales bacterium]
MKILLIDAPFDSRFSGGKKKSLSSVLNIIPSLGLGYLAAIAEREGHQVRVLDCAMVPGENAVAITARTFAPDVIGLTATTPSMPSVLETARAAREAAPGASVIVGGPHPTAMPAATAVHDEFDFVVVGEGEVTFARLLRYLSGAGPESPDEIEGIAFRRAGGVVTTAPREHIADLDTLPFPERRLFPPLKSYRPTPASCRRLPLAHVMTSRGCPSRCRFCDRAVFGERFRARGAGDVMAEIEELVRTQGVREIRFFDDTFTLNRRRLEEICSALRGFRPRLAWTCLTKVDAVRPDTLRMMREAGCWQVLFGLESGDDRVLESLGKKTTVEQNRRAVLWAREAGLRVRADFLVGSPMETLQSLEKTLAFAKSLPLDFAHFNKFVPFPGSSFYAELVGEEQVIDFTGGASILDHEEILYVPPGLTRDAFREFLNRSYRSFYLRPRYLAGRLAAMRTLTELRGSIRGAIDINSI